ncbi:hypothetical protein H8N00_16060 [Streptomyces sp. AC563]|uniref:hypothetical protein n=1 Tax=Streptomyces buecherae TaxID=2763006 RepID=UPI00164DA274|nr:hypothetical protein [Streptomyces buecherae]MBC3987280.1 hypothetical protein [Streptomyces buecherae]MBC3990362.1 hypothetical protein [Streptomyces buecherae]QNJ38640.1 hypothetical protein H7H31_00930 [Streptomyces buecherae]
MTDRVSREVDQREGAGQPPSLLGRSAMDRAMPHGRPERATGRGVPATGERAGARRVLADRPSESHIVRGED